MVVVVPRGIVLDARASYRISSCISFDVNNVHISDEAFVSLLRTTTAVKKNRTYKRVLTLGRDSYAVVMCRTEIRSSQ